MASTEGPLKIASIIGVVMILITSILLWVYGSKLRNDQDLGNKVTLGNVFLGFGVMNIVFALVMLATIFLGCSCFKEVTYQ